MRGLKIRISVPSPITQPRRFPSLAAELVWAIIRMETVFMNIESEKYIAIKRASFERLAAEPQVRELCWLHSLAQ